MKKLLFLLLVSGLLMVGCSDDTGTTDSQSKGEITVWAHPYTDNQEKEGEMWKELIASYEDASGVKVNFQQIPWANRDQKILTALAANNGPDVFYAIPDQMPQYAEAGMLVDLSPYMENNDMDDFVESSLVPTKWKGKMYGVPILQSVETFMYNVEVVKAIGEDPFKLPTTWEEFEEWAAKAKEKGYYASSFQGGGSMNGTLYPYLWQAGGEILTEDNKVMINNESGVEAFEFINKLYGNGWIPQDSITALDHDALWDSGKLLSIQGAGKSVSRMLEKETFEFVIAPPLKNKKQATYGTTGMFVVPVNSDNKDAAAEFIKVITNAENQRKFNRETQFIPTRESAKDIYDDQKYLAQLASYTEFTQSGVIHPEGRNIMPLIQAELQTMLEGKKTPKEAADAAAKAIEGKLK
ncbi:sugar ABC transporter substrate-binding protein [Psychrobacillus sp. BL-248-WT-3]|uniref:sugar ABC transporter substrate-binding protein n=1 Tax=Psychrobacillus sp. BL-248-WT-3 TaxID=2725306 RepID=UPI001F0EDB10|nr:sugar ABC transporter substrate-binding protein [Psychrobacillus sp. BL-248-WT-3]